MRPRLAPDRDPRPVGGTDHYWLRLAATGLCYLVFGISALLLGLVVMPMIRLLSANPERSRLRARAVMGAGMRAFVCLMQATRVLSFSFEGRARLGSPGQMIIANHPTLIDVLFLLGFVPHATCIVKSGLFTNLFTGAALKAVDHIPNTPTDEMIQRAERCLREGQTLVIFPEGTRTVPGRPMHLQRGAANIALRGASVLTPVYIDCEPPTLSKNQPWYRIPARRVRFSLRVGEDIALSGYRSNPLPRASRRLNADLTMLFADRLSRNARS